jgi:hypothetical protein
MLLTGAFARASRDDRDSGSAMAAVVAVVGVTVLIAVSLVATTVFGMGLTTGGRQSVQARAAAEAGLDYGRSSWSTCTGGGGGTIPVPAGTKPAFTLQVAHREDAADGWTNGCPKPDSTEVRIRSTGFADGSGPVESRPQKVMEGVYGVVVAEPARPLFPHTVMGGNGIEVASPTGTSVDIKGSMSTPGNLLCNGAMNQTSMLNANGTVFQPGHLHLGGAVTGTGVCTSEFVFDKDNKKKNEKYDGDHLSNQFPKIVKDDWRLGVTLPTYKLSEVIMMIDPSSYHHPCDIAGWASSAVKLGNMQIDARECSQTVIPGRSQHKAGPLKINAAATLELTGDLIWLVDDFDLTGYISVTSTTGPHSVYVIKPWERAPTDPCPTGATKGIDMLGGGFRTGPDTKIMLYSSGRADVRTDINMSGQIYGCDVRLAALTQLQFGNFSIMTPPVAAGLRLVSKTDVG